MSAISTCELTRVFGHGQGVHGLNLQVPEGAVYGFLGPNGAGKTTTIRLLLGLLRPDAGEVRLFGSALTHSDRRALGTVGAMVENPSLYPHLSAYDNLEVTRRLIDAPVARIDEVLKLVNLDDPVSRRKRVRELSLGMRQRLGIALALLGSPRLLILDEPSNGLDPAGIVEMRRFILRMTRELGVTVFLSSHLLTEVEQLASHVGVIHEGHLLFEGTLEELRSRSGETLEIACGDGKAAYACLREAGEAPELVDANTLHLDHPRQPDHVINRLLVEHGHAVSRLVRHRQSLDTLFFELTGEREKAA
ncbi:MAG: ABC transporter ATP-binding protein [Rhodanobacteraceae bacterium]